MEDLIKRLKNELNVKVEYQPSNNYTYDGVIRVFYGVDPNQVGYMYCKGEIVRYSVLQGSVITDIDTFISKVKGLI